MASWAARRSYRTPPTLGLTLIGAGAAPDPPADKRTAPGDAPQISGPARI